VFGGQGKWSWDEPKKGMYKRMHQIARDNGLMPLDFETPHIQLTGTSSSTLRDGRYPDSGDDAWAGNLAMAISAWTKAPAPPFPEETHRPAIA
jgi:peptidoglycan L-alanyl-D-glutamate endopeptidase CwlK